MASTVVGLDFGHGVIRAAEVAGAGKGQPTLLRYREIEVPAAAVDRGEVIEKGTISAALKELWSRAKFGSRKVVLGVGNQRVLVRDLAVPRATPERIRETLPFHVQDILPVPVAEALLDFYPIAETVDEGKELTHGLLVAAIKDSVLGNVEAAQMAKLSPVHVDLIPFALARMMLWGDAGRGTVAHVHVGATSTSIVVALDGVPHFVRILQNGGDDITTAIAAGVQLDWQQAEELKRQLGLAGAGVPAEQRPALEVIYSATGDLIMAIRNTLAFFVQARPGLVIDRILVSGGGGEMFGFREALAEATRLPTERIDPLAQLNYKRGADTAAVEHAGAGIAVSVALATGSRA